MANGILSVSLPARFLAAGQCSGTGITDIPVSAPAFLLIVQEGGRAAEKSAGASVCRQALLLPPGAVLPDGFRCGSAACRYWVRFGMISGSAATQVHLSLLPIPLPETAFNRLSCGFHQLAGAARGRSGPSDLCDYILSVLLLTLQDVCRPVPRSVAAARMLEYIGVHCCERLTLPDLSRALGYSEDYLSRLLHDQVSCSFREYIHRLRMQRAKRELLSGTRSIQEIAWDCGYSNAKFFSTSFLKYEGLAPSAYRNLYGSGFCRENPEN